MTKIRKFQLSEFLHNQLIKLKKISKKAFTLIEMMIVLLIISVLVLLFIPNLSKQKDTVSEQGDEAIVKTVETQIEVYEINHNQKITDSKLKELVTPEQYKVYKKYKN
ncbi:competence type IV pilus major pilin ComGC [Tetragenococcus halophilus]|uniref:competence type IV pilus major pilin ComGC n=1 Tax=Tetragenococcus halophilus TaxID=51669 RepID=UPI001F3F4152|nr:competence type IV pilus major pilin ComGC [Tetragenococcus halophilus]MCF1685188.1 prepilin-type N-terminal cleavage/methylation domain-containing protein [Tetragenococcus halophilus]MCO7025770.1 prepilin-type N-terminal cleavage/methylation domain-containing protein [Tetragenococcus halophilus]MCO8288878.1 prepilin-type N-terminal cleavage/methylation domain-containing protein [Tetragenococcus halophilus]MDN6292270.1 prepilin-type N-terminal cleavage/methylation domain-containing protein [